MSEDLKRELEGFSEVVSEKTEDLIKDLLEEGEGEPSGQSLPHVSKRGKGYLIFFGIFLTLLSIALGLFILWNILNRPQTQRISKITEEVAQETSATKLEGSSEIEKEKKGENFDKEKIVPPKLEKEKKYNYNLKLSNFLFPLDEKNFLKVDVYLYFASYEEYRRAQEREFALRKFFYQELKKAEATLWKSERKVREFEDKLRELIIKGNIEVLPEKLELEGVILKT